MTNIDQYRGTVIGSMTKKYCNTAYLFGISQTGFIDVIYYVKKNHRIIESFWILDRELEPFIDRRWRAGWRGMYETRNKQFQ